MFFVIGFKLLYDDLKTTNPTTNAANTFKKDNWVINKNIRNTITINAFFVLFEKER